MTKNTFCENSFIISLLGRDTLMLRTVCGQVPQRAKLVRHACSLPRFGRQARTNAAHKATTPLGSNVASGGHAQTDVRRHSLHSFGWRRHGAAKATRVANAKPPKSAPATAAVTATDPATATTTSAEALTGHMFFCRGHHAQKKSAEAD